MTFDMKLSIFLDKWKNQINGTGFFSEYDVSGNFIVINPSNCGLIEFREVE
jgi:hypothetical protein